MHAELTGDSADATPLPLQRMDRLVAGFAPGDALLAGRFLLRTWTDWCRAWIWIPPDDGFRLAGWWVNRIKPNLLECGMLANEQALEQVAEVRQQMPAIGDLDGIRCSLSGAIGIGAAPITADDLNTGVCLQPGGKGRGLGIRQ
jgi:hypothetical protein